MNTGCERELALPVDECPAMSGLILGAVRVGYAGDRLS